jgi:hypothetical protein
MDRRSTRCTVCAHTTRTTRRRVSYGLKDVLVRGDLGKARGLGRRVARTPRGRGADSLKNVSLCHRLKA